MQEDAGFEVRPLRETDLPYALRLQALARWNQTESDWRREMALDGLGCFGAFVDGRLIGTITTATYSGALAWIGMVLVDPEYRKQGIGTELLKKTIELLDSEHIGTMKLDATP